MKATVVAVVLLATAAIAAPKPKVILDAPGPMKAVLTKVLKKKFTPVPPKGKLPNDPGANAVREAVRATGAVAIVTARLEAGVWSVMALNGADGTPLEQFKFKAPAGKKPLKALPKGTDKRLEKALGDAKAPAKEDVKKDEPPPVKKDEPVKDEPVATAPPPKKGKTTPPPPSEPPPPTEPPPPAEKPKPPPPAAADDSESPQALNLGVGMKWASRRLFYTDDIFKALSKYSLPVGPSIQAELDVFPAAFFTKGVPAHIGLSLGFSYMLGVSSVASDGSRYSTSALRFRAALMGRIPFGPLELRPHFGWSLQNFNIANGAAGAAKPNIPNVSYSNLRAGLGVKVNLIGPLAVNFGFAYQAPLSVGEISSTRYFPRLKAGGLDANGGISLSFFKRVELRLGVEYIRYWYSMNPEPGDQSVAGGALDDSFGGGFILAFTL